MDGWIPNQLLLVELFSQQEQEKARSRPAQQEARPKARNFEVIAVERWLWSMWLLLPASVDATIIPLYAARLYKVFVGCPNYLGNTSIIIFYINCL